jgi:N-acyl-D-amino-acid deacylase
MIIAAQRSGSRVTCDAYPYTASSTTLDVLIPKAAREGGGAKLRERLLDPVSRKRIVSETVRQMKSEGWKDFSFARVAYCDFAPEYNGMTISDIASLLEKTKHGQGKGAAPDLSLLKSAKSMDTDQRAKQARRSAGPSSVESQAEAICYLASRGSVQMIYENMSEDDVANILMFPDCMLGSDSNIRNGEGRPHPRGYGSAPRLLSLLARERGLFSLEEAVRRMTSLPADTFGIANRGKLAPGCWADVVIFDPAGIKDQATYESPFRAPDGIAYVLVNGKISLDHGSSESLTAGHAIKRDF